MEVITPTGAYAWHDRFGNLPPSGIAELYNGYPTGEAACAKRGAIFQPQATATFEPNVCVWQDGSWAGALSYGLRCPDTPPYKYVYVTACTKTLSCPQVPAGETPFTPDSGGQTCSRPEQETYTLTLTPESATIEPGKSDEFAAKVIKTGGGVPSKPIPVSVKVEVDPISGGHDHGEKIAKRDKGSVAPAAGVTEFPFTFTSTEVSGTHTITATCDLCTNKTASAEVTVKVNGLETIPTSQFFALEEPNPDKPDQTRVIGATDKHSANHYLMPEAANRLLAIAIYYQTQSQFKVLDWRTNALVTLSLLHVNDASLKWGGKFDISGTWTGSHKEHKRGTSVDLRANENVGAIPPERFEMFEELIDSIITEGGAGRKYLRECSPNAAKTETNPNPIRHNRTPENYCVSQVDGSLDTNRHFHVRLLGD